MKSKESKKKSEREIRDELLLEYDRDKKLKQDYEARYSKDKEI